MSVIGNIGRPVLFLLQTRGSCAKPEELREKGTFRFEKENKFYGSVFDDEGIYLL
jgi:hypothetical protein